jgi:hypothetical protein
MINTNIKKDVISFEIKGKTIVFCHESIASSGKSKKYFAKRQASELLKAFKEASTASTKDDHNAKYLTMRKLFSNDVAKELRVDSSAMSEKLCRKTKYCSTASNCQKAFELLASGKLLSIAEKIEPKYNSLASRQNVKSKTAKKHIVKAKKPNAKKVKTAELETVTA